MSSVRFKSVLLIGSLAVLSACGGGGSSGVSAQYPLDTAVSAFYQMPESYKLSGTSGGNNFTLDLTITPGGQASFDGVQAMTAKTSSTETENGVAAGSATATEYFLTTPFTQIGALQNSGLAQVDSEQKPLPELAAAGDNGSLDTQKYYSDSSLGTQVATGTRSWTLTALTADTAQFCISDTDDVGGPSETEIDCFDLDIKGNVSAI